MTETRNYVVNGLSLNMLRSDCTLTVRNITIKDAINMISSSPYRSAVGHADIASVISVDLGTPVALNRETLYLESGDELIVAQYTGPRLPEGAVELPDGAKIFYKHVVIGGVN